AGRLRSEHRAQRLGEAAELDDAEPEGQKEADGQEHADDPGHEQRVGERLNRISEELNRAGHQMLALDWPPSTVAQAPVIQLARGEARKATSAATSSGLPNRPNGISRRMNSAMPAGSSCWRFHHDPPSKRIEPGATLLTRILSPASCCAIALARLISAALTAL